MKISNYFIKTYKDLPSDEDLMSQKLLVKAGFIKKHSQGIYIYLPMGLKVLENIKKIVREEMNNVGFHELQMPILLTQETYEKRIENFGHEMFKLNDRGNRPFCLGPTHEEPFTTTVGDALTSYKQLPMALYQINNKYRDEKRPRFGLMRAKEFIMKDAYSYDKDVKSLDKTYQNVKQAYCNIFSRVGLDFVPVGADNGVMGGSKSEEFMAKSEVGEADIVLCDCGYAVNIETAPCSVIENTCDSELLEKELVYTPDTKTVDELVAFLKKEPSDFLKAVIYKADNKNVLALVRGDREINETKLAKYLKCNELEMANGDDIISMNSVAGYVGAFNLKNCIVLADNEVKNMRNFIIGANKLNYHYVNANIKDIKVDVYLDMRNAVEGDKCPICSKPITIKKGIEVGHIFKNDTHYTEALNCKFLDENGKLIPAQMGCYGIGIGRTMSAVVEQMYDDNGMVWPESIAPFKYAIIPVNVKDEVQYALAEKLYKKLGVDSCLFDDRKDTFGFRMKDLELFGIPYIIIVGKNAANGIVEIYERKTNKKFEEKIENIKF